MKSLWRQADPHNNYVGGKDRVQSPLEIRQIMLPLRAETDHLPTSVNPPVCSTCANHPGFCPCDRCKSSLDFPLDCPSLCLDLEA